MYYVYRFLDKSRNIIYVGKSKQDLEQRFRGHLHLPNECYDLTYTIEYIECATESDMSIKEIYYINKYHNEQIFFNVLDMTDVPVSVEFNDDWKQYTGPLGAHFRHSINYLEGYTKEKIVRYNKDGTVDRRKTNKEKGVDSYVDGLTSDEVNLIVDHLISEINNAENENQEQIRFRNLLMFVLGVNLPIKSNEFLCLKYSDLFDDKDRPKPFELKLGRFHKDEIIYIPLRNVVQEVLLAYTEYCGLSYADNADDDLFQSRKHQVISPISWARILKEAAAATAIAKNIGAESVRKTYGLNIYQKAESKLNALLFLGELWGQTREAQIINYLNLDDEIVDFDYYLGEEFSLCKVDISQIECLEKNSTSTKRTQQPESVSENKGITFVAKDVSKKTQKKKSVKMFSRETKLEIIEKFSNQHISLKTLSKEYGVAQKIIASWILDYNRLGEEALGTQGDV